MQVLVVISVFTVLERGYVQFLLPVDEQPYVSKKKSTHTHTEEPSGSLIATCGANTIPMPLAKICVGQKVHPARNLQHETSQTTSETFD